MRTPYLAPLPRRLAPRAAIVALAAGLLAACAPFGPGETDAPGPVEPTSSPGSAGETGEVAPDPGTVGGKVVTEVRPPSPPGATGALTTLLLAARGRTREATFDVELPTDGGEVWVAVVSNGESSARIDRATIDDRPLVSMGERRSGTLSASAARGASPGRGSHELTVRMTRDDQGFVVAFGVADGRVEAVGFAAESPIAMAEAGFGGEGRRLGLLGLTESTPATTPAPVESLTIGKGASTVHGKLYQFGSGPAAVQLGSAKAWALMSLEGHP